MYVEPDRPRATIIEVVLACSDEDDSHAVPRSMTNEDVTIIQCRTAADIVSTSSLQPTRYTVFRYEPVHECTKNKWPLDRRDSSFIGNSDNAGEDNLAVRSINGYCCSGTNAGKDPLPSLPLRDLCLDTLLVIV